MTSFESATPPKFDEINFMFSVFMAPDPKFDSVISADEKQTHWRWDQATRRRALFAELTRVVMRFCEEVGPEAAQLHLSGSQRIPHGTPRNEANWAAVVYEQGTWVHLDGTYCSNHHPDRAREHWAGRSLKGEDVCIQHAMPVARVTTVL